MSSIVLLKLRQVSLNRFSSQAKPCSNRHCLEVCGFDVAASGVALLALNLLDGLQKLATTKTPFPLRVLVIQA
jgi:hypothetical protein